MSKFKLKLYENIKVKDDYEITIKHSADKHFFDYIDIKLPISLEIEKSEEKKEYIAEIIDPFGNSRKKFYCLKTFYTELEEYLNSLFDISEVIKYRKAYRAISEKKIDKNILDLLVYSAKLAPSCANKQPWNFRVISEGKLLEKIKEALPGGNYWVKKSPVIIAVYAKKEDDCILSDNRDYFLFDTGLAVGNLLSQATQFGLIAHPIAGFEPIKVKEALGIGNEFVLITLIVLGYYGDISSLSDKHQKSEYDIRKREV
ncbi:nitroreductase family protein [Marinitoga arctica]